MRRTMKWLTECVIGYDLCPFAIAALTTTRCVSSEATATEDILLVVEREARNLVEGHQALNCGSCEAQAAVPTTTLLVLPRGSHVEDFEEFMSIVGLSQELIEQSDFANELQLVPFHPRAVFDDNVNLSAGSDAFRRSDPADFTARSPYPVIHFLLEREVSAALDGFRRLGKSTSKHIIEKNKRTLRAMGNESLHQIFVEDIFSDE